MKKLILLIIASTLGAGAWAGCEDPETSLEAQKCLSNEVRNLKVELNTTYSQVYKSTEAKQQLDLSQKKWLEYKDAQCGTFVVADTQGSPATVEYDLMCQTVIIKQRIDFLKNFLIN